MSIRCNVIAQSCFVAERILTYFQQCLRGFQTNFAARLNQSRRLSHVFQAVGGKNRTRWNATANTKTTVRRRHVRKRCLKYFIIFFNTRCVAQNTEQFSRQWTLTDVPIVVPQANCRQNCTRNGLQFDARYIVFKATTVRKTVHIGDELHRI